MDRKKEALRELLKVLSDHPEVADRITITIKPSKIKQGAGKLKKVNRVKRSITVELIKIK